MGPSLRSSMLCTIGALLILSFRNGAFAQTSPCSTSTLAPLQPCLPYIATGNLTRPGSDCCNPLRALLNSSNPECICQIAPLAASTGLKINTTRAIDIAAQCNQTVPSSVTSCLTANTTAPSPSGSTTPSPPPPPPGSSNSSSGGSNNGSHGSALLPPFVLVCGSIFVSLIIDLSMST